MDLIKMVYKIITSFDISNVRTILKRIQQYSIMFLIVVSVYAIAGFVINMAQITLFWTIRYVNKRLYRQINYYLMYWFQSHMLFLGTWWSGSKIKMYIERDDYKKICGKEYVLLLGNHSYEIDWLMGWYFGDTIGVLGNCKAFMKKSLQYVPVLGWTWKFGEYIFLDRSFEKDKKNIQLQIRELGDFPDPVWLLLFPEGTRLTPAKLKASQEYAIKHNLPALKHHLLPRTKGFIASLEGMKDKIHVLYDCQVAFDKNAVVAPTMANMLLGKPVEAHIYLKRIKVEDLPKDKAGLTKWLYDRFEFKDKLQDSFHNTGSFFKESGITPIEPYVLERRIWSLVIPIFWTSIIIIPLLCYSIPWLLNGGMINAVIAIVVILLLNYTMKGLVGVSEIDKSSQYGVTK